MAFQVFSAIMKDLCKKGIVSKISTASFFIFMSCLGVRAQFPVTYMEVGWNGLVLNEMVNSKYPNNCDTLVFTREASHMVKSDTIRVRTQYSFCNGLFIGEETYYLSKSKMYNTYYEYENGYIHQIYGLDGNQKQMRFVMTIDSVGSDEDVISIDGTHQFVRTYDDRGRITSLSNAPSKNEDCRRPYVFETIFGDRGPFAFSACDSIHIDCMYSGVWRKTTSASQVNFSDDETYLKLTKRNRRNILVSERLLFSGFLIPLYAVYELYRKGSAYRLEIEGGLIQFKWISDTQIEERVEYDDGYKNILVLNMETMYV
jgi:hypothetical protein